MTTVSLISNDTCPQCKADLRELRQLSNPPTYCLQCRFPIVLIANKYQLVRILGEGGFGSVYLAQHIRLKRNAERVVKLLKPDMFARAGMEERFYREVQVTSDLSQRNEHIVRIYDDFGEVPQLGHYYVMEYLQGKPLTDYILHHQVQPLAWVIDIFAQLCDAIQAAHEEGIIHRDIKPDNILLIERRNIPHFVKVLDFGIAKPTQDSGRTNLNLTQGALGTPMYMPPEQATNRPIDGRSDLYAMGLILYEMLTGRHPFIPPEKSQSMSPLELLTAQMMHQPPSLRDIRPDLNIPEELEQVTLKALAKLPEQRYQSVREFWLALRAAVPNIPVQEITSTREERPPLPTPVEPTSLRNDQDALRTTYAPSHDSLSVSNLSEKQISALPPTGEHFSPHTGSSSKPSMPVLAASSSATPSLDSFAISHDHRHQHSTNHRHSQLIEEAGASRLGLWITLGAVAVVLVVVILFTTGWFQTPPTQPEPRKRIRVALKNQVATPPPIRNIRETPPDAGVTSANTNNTPTDTEQPSTTTQEPENRTDTPEVVEPRPTRRVVHNRRRTPRHRPTVRRVVVPSREVAPRERDVVVLPPPPRHGCPEGQVRLYIQSCPAGGGKFTLTMGDNETEYRPSQAICLAPSSKRLGIGQEGCRDCIFRLPKNKISVQLYLKDGSDKNTRLSESYCLPR